MLHTPGLKTTREKLKEINYTWYVFRTFSYELLALANLDF